MVINKLLGAALFIIGGYLAFVLWNVNADDYETFTIAFIGSVLLIYFGLKLMGFL